MCFCRKLVFGSHALRRYSTDILQKSTPLARERAISYRANSLCTRVSPRVALLDSIHHDQQQQQKRDFSSGNVSFAASRGKTIKSRLDAEVLIRKLSEKELELLTRSMRDFEEEKQLVMDSPVSNHPSNNQLVMLLLQNAIPFVGFGFLDNAIMIVAGDYIDSTIGITFGISTMAAAAIGNLISDCCGIGLAGYVEMLASKLGIDPRLTSAQLAMAITKKTEYAGRAVGIIIGCLLGMIPLIFLNNDVGDKEKKEK